MKTMKQTAHKAGWLYLAFLAIGIFNFFYIPSKIFVHENAVLTVQNILSNEVLFRFGILSHLIGQVIFLFLVLVLYQLFKDINKDYAQAMVLLVVVSVPMAFNIILNQVNAISILSNAAYLSSFEMNQKQALSMLFYEFYNSGIIIIGIFWGLWLFPFGYLVMRSGFIPKILGVLLIMSGVAFLIDSLSLLLVPNYHKIINNIISLPMSAGEIAMIVWLLFKGVKEKP